MESERIYRLISKLIHIFFFATQIQASPTYFITAPNVIRYSTDTTVSVIVSGVNQPVTMNIFLQDYPDKTKSFSERQVEVGRAQPESLSVIVHPSDMPESDDELRYVYLTAESTDPDFSFSAESVPILVTGDSGYIFIQTDKPIYNPRQQVKIRVVPVDERMKPTRWPVQMDIVNPQGITVERKEMTWDEEHFLYTTFTLPSIPIIGNWSVTASYTNGITTSKTAIFEVKEYVLPTYSVKVRTDRKYILPSDDVFDINFDARYVYGKSVQGTVAFKISLLLDGIVKEMIQTTTHELKDGTTHYTIRDDWILAANDGLGFPDGGRLQVEAVVTETATGKKERVLDTSIVLLNTPFEIHFTQSQNYFKPEMKYSLHVYVRLYNTDIPERNLPLGLQITWKRQGMDFAEEREGVTDENGILTAEIDTGPNDYELEFQVTTQKLELADEQQATSTLTVPAYSSPSRSYLKVSTLPEFKVGGRLSASTWNRESGQIEKIIFLVVSRGNIVHHASSNQNLGQIGMTVTMETGVTADMVPNGRVIAFYIRDEAQNPEVVADSVKFDVEDTCADADIKMESVEGTHMSPTSLISLKVTGKPRTVVGLLAVDEAVYLLNSRNTLRHHSIFRAMEKHDLGCGFGGGRDRHGVFQDAGLAVITNADLNTHERTSIDCNHGNRRRKRSVEELIRQNHICCRTGFELGLEERNLTLCMETRLDVFNTTEDRHCARMFYQCCKQGVRRQKEADEPPSEGEGRSGPMIVGGLSFDDIDDDDSKVTIRQVFPESWMFEEVKIGGNGEETHRATLPDSITTWVFQGVGMSQEHGICVAEPVNVTAFKDFFISLDLPYSAVQMEQMEVRATIFNYRNIELPVRVYMKGTEGICSSARPGRDSPKIEVFVPANDAVTVKFPIVPLKPGSFAIDVVALSAGASDYIRKELYVRSEGREVIKTVSFWLDPQCTKEPEDGANGNVVKTECREGENIEYGEVNMLLPPTIVPGSEKAQARVIGNIMESAVTEIIAGNSLERWLRKPAGCGEQTMILTAPTVSVMNYLHRTNQVTPDIEKRGHKFISDGIQRELIYRKADGSFSVWTDKPASTWLTAFVMKTFCQAKKFVHVDDKNAICSGVEWLASQQNEDGKFIESFWVYHKEMIGGVNGDSTMTAYILVSLLECDCRPEGTEEKILTSISYLENQLQHMTRPLAVALAAYALALADSPKKFEANDKLIAMALHDDRGHTYWSHSDNFHGQIRPYWHKNNPSALDVETTAYALLTQLQHNNLQGASSIVEWLLRMRGSGGTFVSTQDTVIALQALSEYNVRTYAAEIDMRTTIRSSSQAQFSRTLELKQETALVQRTVDNIPMGNKLFVETVGTGLGRIEIDVQYNMEQSHEELCKFDVDIEVSDVRPTPEDMEKANDDAFICDACMRCIPKGIEPEADDYVAYWDDYAEDFYDQDKQEVLKLKMPEKAEIRIDADNFPKIGGDRKKRASDDNRIEVDDNASKKQICLTTSVRHRSNKVIDMAIVDVGLPTGYVAVKEDLVKMQEDGIINEFEITHRSVIFYLDSIPSDQSVLFKFKATEEFKVGNRQSAQVHVYDYYDPTEECVAFYSPREGGGDIDVMCENRVCQCAESLCMECWAKKQRQLTYTKMRKSACLDADYVMSIKINQISNSTDGKFTHYTAEVRQVHKSGIELLDTGDVIHYWQPTRCVSVCDIMEEGKTYFIMGLDGKKFVEDDGTERYKYFLDDRTLLVPDLTLMSRNRTRLRVLILRIKGFLRQRGCPN